MQQEDERDPPKRTWSKVPPSVVKGIIGIGLFAVVLYASLLIARIWVLFFSSILLALLLDAAASLLRTRVFRGRLTDSQVFWVPAVVVLFIAAVGALGFLLGPSISVQIETLSDQIPNAFDRLRGRLAEHQVIADAIPSSSDIRQALQPGSPMAQGILRGFGSLLGALGSAGIVIVVGFYLALQPSSYVHGTLLLVPQSYLARAEEALNAAGHALRRWLVGRMLSMLAVFLLTTLVLWLLGSPLALSLGLLAGLLTFIPFIGPIVSAVPAILMGLMESELQALWIALAYVLVQFLEGNVITPLVQSYAVSLRPALLIAAQVIAGTLFGLPGIIVATPMAVAAIVFVQVLYLRHHLHKDVELLGVG